MNVSFFLFRTISNIEKEKKPCEELLWVLFSKTKWDKMENINLEVMYSDTSANEDN